jgi:DNA-binding Lrp family transcriptional regulator
MSMQKAMGQRDFKLTFNISATGHQMTNNRPLDELDQAILACLRDEPQQTNKSIADKLAVTEITVSSRIRAMENDGAMKIVAQQTFRSAGHEVLANVDLIIRGRSIDALADELAGIPEIAAVTVNIGDPSLSLLVMAPSLNQLQTMVTERIAKFDGVTSVETMIYANVIKYRSDYALL